jgi:thioredoxin-related protein
MITIEKGTKNKLVVVTSPNCSVCREMQKSNKCEDIPLTRKLVLAPFSPTDELSLQAIFKAKNPLEAYKTLLSGKPLNPEDIDWSKDTDKIWEDNINMFDYLTKNFEVKGTPSFFIMNEDGEIVEQVKLEMEPADVLMFNIKKFQD